MTVRLLNIGQYNAVKNAKFAKDSFFNPLKDADGNWIISNEEVEQCVESEFFPWIENLPEITYKPVTPE